MVDFVEYSTGLVEIFEVLVSKNKNFRKWTCVLPLESSILNENSQSYIDLNFQNIYYAIFAKIA